MAALWACSGVAGPGARGGDGEPRPVLDPAPPSADVRCQGPPLPPLTTRSDLIEDPARRARPLIVYEWAGREDANLGIGHFRTETGAVEGAATDAPPGAGLEAEWAKHVVFPLFDAPAGEHLGWFDRGWVVLGFGYDALHRQGSGAGQVETSYEQQTLIALDSAAGGWFRIRHTEPRGDDPGTAWVHACHLLGTPVALVYESWEEVFAGLEDIPIHFRARVRHSLRNGPATDSARVAWIPADPGETQIHLLEIAGDWARVRVERPPSWCAPEPPAEVSAEEGWIKWRDAEKGPWIWWYTRGC